MSKNECSSDVEVEFKGEDSRQDTVFNSRQGVKDLEQFLVKMRKKLFDVRGDGNCLFHAFMAAVDESRKTGEIVVGDNFPENHTVMRTRLVEHLLRIRGDFLSEDKKESWKYGLKPLDKDKVNGRFECSFNESWEDCLARTLDTKEWLDYAMMDGVWCSDFFLQMLVSLMEEWGVKQRNGEPVKFFYMYVTPKTKQTYLLGYEYVIPIDLKQNVSLERQKISKKEQRKQGDFHNEFYRKRQAVEIKMPKNGDILIVHHINHYSATTDIETQDDWVQNTTLSILNYVELHKSQIREIRDKFQNFAPIYDDLCFFVDSLNKLHSKEIAPDSATTDKSSCFILEKQQQNAFSVFILESQKQETAICNSFSQVRTLMLELFPFSFEENLYLMKTLKTKDVDIAQKKSIDFQSHEILLEKISSTILIINKKFQSLQEEWSLVKKNLGKGAQELIKDIEDIFLRDTRDSNIDLLVLGIKSMQLVNSIALLYENNVQDISTELDTLNTKFFRKDGKNEEETTRTLVKRCSDSADRINGKKFKT
jgi:hypothetical protein